MREANRVLEEEFVLTKSKLDIDLSALVKNNKTKDTINNKASSTFFEVH